MIHNPPHYIMAPGKKHPDNNYYSLLGVSRRSSIQEIKSAFRKLSMKTHPDRGGSNEEQARVNNAYEILSDPERRRGYNESLSNMTVRTPEKPVNRSRHADEWERSFRGSAVKESVRDRLREAVKRKSEEIRSGHSSRVEAVYADACRAFMKIRSACFISASAALICSAAAVAYPALWAGAVLSGYFIARYSRYGDGDDAVFILHSEWRYRLKQQSRKRVRREDDAMRAHLDNVSDCLDRMLSAAQKPSRAMDAEGTVLRRLLIHFFLMGYAPVSHDADARIVTVRGGDDAIAIRYRHRSGSPVNTAFVRKLYEYMEGNNIRKGYLFAAPGLSGNAAEFADSCVIAHYSIGELNSWIAGITSRYYPGPRGDIIECIDSFMKFIREM